MSVLNKTGSGRALTAGRGRGGGEGGRTVSAAVVIAHVPAHGRLAANFPHCAGRHFWQSRAPRSVVRVGGVDIVTSLQCVGAPRRTASKSTHCGPELGQ
jgi:hypothetical protein